MAQLGVGSEISLRRHRGPIHNSYHLIKPSLSIVGCLLLSSQCATAAIAVTAASTARIFRVQVVIFGVQMGVHDSVPPPPPANGL